MCVYRKINSIANHAEESEKVIEDYLVKRCKEEGWKALKYSNPSETGYPDRIIVLPRCMVVWVELKSKGKHPRPIQQKRMKELNDLGHNTYVCDSKQLVDEIIKLCKLIIG